MQRRDDLIRALFFVALLMAILHLVYAASNGISDQFTLRWGLAACAALGAVLTWRASRPGPWWLAWPGFLLAVLPLAVTWPAAGLSLAGLVVILLAALLFVGLVLASLPKRSAA